MGTLYTMGIWDGIKRRLGPGFLGYQWQIGQPGCLGAWQHGDRDTQETGNHSAKLQRRGWGGGGDSSVCHPHTVITRSKSPLLQTMPQKKNYFFCRTNCVVKIY